MAQAMTRKEFQALLDGFPEDAIIGIRRDIVKRDTAGKKLETKQEFFGLLDVEIDFDEDTNRIVIIGPAIKAGEETTEFEPTD
jgi:hypothetical protein